MTQHKSRYLKLLLWELLCGVILVTSVTVGYIAGKNQSVSNIELALVIRVIDGDTLELENGQRVRYIRVNAPETVHPEKGIECYGPEASLYNKEIVEGKIVELQKGIEDKDKYGRLLRYVYVDGVFVNAQLVASGHAYASSYGAENRFRQIFVQLQQYSKQNNRGLWSVCQ